MGTVYMLSDGWFQLLIHLDFPQIGLVFCQFGSYAQGLFLVGFEFFAKTEVFNFTCLKSSDV